MSAWWVPQKYVDAVLHGNFVVGVGAGNQRLFNSLLVIANCNWEERKTSNHDFQFTNQIELRNYLPSSHRAGCSCFADACRALSLQSWWGGRERRLLSPWKPKCWCDFRRACCGKCSQRLCLRRWSSRNRTRLCPWWADWLVCLAAAPAENIRVRFAISSASKKVV